MPYILLVLGLLIAIFALYRFFLSASVEQIKALFLTAILLVVCLALFYLSVTGRFAAALGIVVAAAPVALGYYKARKRGKIAQESGDANPVMDRKQALEILGLPDDASTDDIKTTYKKLMKKVHPDQEGSQWMAEKLNAAKEFLLKDTHS